MMLVKAATAFPARIAAGQRRTAFGKARHAQRLRHASEHRHRPWGRRATEISSISASDTGSARINGTSSFPVTDHPHEPSTRIQCLIGGMSKQDLGAPESKG